MRRRRGALVLKPTIAYVLTQDRAGPVDLTVALARELDGRGTAHVLVLGPPPVTSAGPLGELHTDLRITSKRDLAGRRRLRDVLTRVRPDLVHAQDRRAALAVASLRPGMPVVATFHGVPEDVPGSWAAGEPGASRPPARDLAVLAADAVVARRVAMTLAPSQAIADVLTSRLRVPADKVRVLANGVPLTPAHDLPERVRSLLFVGALVPRKGADVLLEAFARVARERPDATLRIVGDGSERAALERRALSPDLTGRVEFAGYRTDVPVELAAADVFVLPSHNENQPLALLEAMGAGLACVATRVGGNADVLPPDAGSLVPAGDAAALAAALVRLLDEPGTAAAQGRRAAELARARYGIGRCADEHQELYLELLARRA